MKRICVVMAALTVTLSASAQSKSFTLGKWVEVQNAILKELNRSYVDSLEVGRIERAGVDAMLEALDPYTVYVPEEEQEDFQMMLNNTYGGIGAIIYKPDVNGNVIINEPYENSPAAKSGLHCGDEIEFIDGVTTHGLTSQESSDRMRGKPGTKVVFKVKKLRAGKSWKAGETIEVTVVRERIQLPSITYVGMLNEKDGYILLDKFTDGVGQGIRDAYHQLKAQGMQRLVLDLRGNGGGLMNEAVNIVSLFVPKGSLVVSAKGRAGGTDISYKTSTDPVDTEIPILVLVDSGSASASEIVSGALQDYDRATIAGTRTFGKGLVQSIRPLPYNGQLKLTTAKYYAGHRLFPPQRGRQRGTHSRFAHPQLHHGPRPHGEGRRRHHAGPDGIGPQVLPPHLFPGVQRHSGAVCPGVCEEARKHSVGGRFPFHRLRGFHQICQGQELRLPFIGPRLL